MPYVRYVSDYLTKATVGHRRKTLSELEQVLELMHPVVSGALPDAKVSVTQCDGLPRVRKLVIESSYDESAIHGAVKKFTDVAHLLADTHPHE